VYYKRMPAPYEWLKIEMQPRGGTGYSASVPLTPEGILYHFEAIDEDGNGVNYPDIMKRTPYLTVDAWDPAETIGGAWGTPRQHPGQGGRDFFQSSGRKKKCGGNFNAPGKTSGFSISTSCPEQKGDPFQLIPVTVEY
jgi:hypothetical protein